MRTFVRTYAFLAMVNTLCGFDLLAEGTFFHQSSPAVQVWSWASTAILGVWAIYVLGRNHD